MDCDSSSSDSSNEKNNPERSSISTNDSDTIVNPTTILQSPTYVSLIRSLAQLCCNLKQEDLEERSGKSCNPISVVSGRQIRKLALMAFSKYIDGFECELDDFIGALQMAIQDAIHDKA